MAALVLAVGAMVDQAFAGPPEGMHRSDRQYAVSRPVAAGRSGTATIESRALIARDAVSVIEVTTASFDSPDDPASGSLAELQIKAYRSGNALAFTRNVTLDQISFQQTDATLYHGQQLQLQALVRAVDGTRTDVVTARPIVRLRPDLAVQQITAPPEGLVGLPLNVSALVTELNRETGARADCILLADGVEADRAPAIWVDAGGSVSCAFRPMFLTPGLKHLRAEVTSVTPGDWDEANNTRSVPVDVRATLPLQPAFAGVIDFEDHAFLYERNAWAAYGPPAQGFESERREGSDGWVQQEYFAAYPQARFTFPIPRLSVSIERDGASRSWTYEDLAATWTWDSGNFAGACAELFDTATDTDRAVMIQVCSTWSADTASGHVIYYRTAGDVTYFANGFTSNWFETPDNTTSYWSWNDVWSSRSGERVPSGAQYTFDAVLLTGGHTFSSRLHVQPEPVTESFRHPPDGYPVCQVSNWGGGETEWCREQTFHRTGFAGFARNP